MHEPAPDDQPTWRRRLFALAVLFGVVLIFVAIFGGPYAARWAMEAGRERMSVELGLTYVADGMPDAAEPRMERLVAFLPGESAYFHSGDGRTLMVDLAVTKDLDETRRCAARIGECESLVVQHVKQGHGPVVAALIRSARPTYFEIMNSPAVEPEIGEALADVGTVETLDLTNVRLEGNGLAALSRAQTIELVLVSGAAFLREAGDPTMSLDAEAFKGLTSAPNLNRIVLGECQMVPGGDWAAAGSPRLKILALRDVVWPPQPGEWLAGMTGLETLSCVGGDRRDLDPEALARLPRLTGLTMGNASLDDAWAERFPSLAGLGVLDLDGNSLSIAAQRKLLTRLPRLEVFTPSDVNATPDEIEALRAEFPRVTLLYASPVLETPDAMESDAASPDEEGAAPMEEAAPVPMDQSTD